MFVRFLEDNELVETPKLAGPGDWQSWLGRLPVFGNEGEGVLEHVVAYLLEHKNVLLTVDNLSERWTSRAKEIFGSLRNQYDFLCPDADVAVADRALDEVRWFTFAGGIINNAFEVTWFKLPQTGSTNEDSMAEIQHDPSSDFQNIRRLLA